MPMNVEQARKVFERVTEAIISHKEYLTELDSAIGDADHGINMSRGFTKAQEKIKAGTYTEVGGVFKDVAMTLMGSVGGASGPLYGTLFMRMSMKFGTKQEVDSADFVEALEEGLKGILALGKAQLEDKTMVDALTPALEAMKAAASNGEDLPTVLEKGIASAEEGMKRTIPLVAKKGRASYLGERSAGHQDPGATSTFLILSAMLEGLRE